MGYIIDMDVGGTFTDGFVTHGDSVKLIKVDTTPHDLTVCFLNCIHEAAKSFGISTRDMLRQTDAVRYSTTTGTNAIIQNRGAKVGLIVSKGFEDSLYDKKKGGKLWRFVSPEMVIGLGEKIDDEGTVVKGVNKEELLRATERLLDAGARIIVISLLNSAVNPANERAMKETVYQDYPRHYLGAVPVLLSSEISVKPGEYERTNTAVINAYLHSDLVKYLYKADEELRKYGYIKPLLMVHSTGGTARVAKTSAISTLSSGPVAGALGSAYISRLYGMENLVSVDIGGTSADIGIIKKGDFAYRYDAAPEIEECPVHINIMKSISIGAGGGSIAKLKGTDVQVGPESAGAAPGPASFNLGGTEPTTTDANLVLGFLDPNYFLGGRKKLARERAVEAIKKRIANPLNITAEEAAIRIVKVLESNVAKRVSEELHSAGVNAGDCTLLAYGGGGPVHCCALADLVGIRKIIVFPYSSVFSAFGVSTSDILHIYESYGILVLQDKLGKYLTNHKPFNDMVRELQDRAARDMKGEGFKVGDITYSLELEITDGMEAFSCTLQLPELSIKSEQNVRKICEAFTKKYSATNGASTPKGGIIANLLRLRATCPSAHFKFPTFNSEGTSPAEALKGKRSVFWDSGFKETDIYERGLLKCGNVVKGPAVIETDNTTYVIPAGKKYTVDKYLNGIIEKVMEKI